MTLSGKGIAFIEGQEGKRLEAYKDQVGIWTIGVGHTGPEVVSGLRWTLEQVTYAFKKDVAKFEEAVTGAVKLALSQFQFDALVSFTFNVGVGNFVTSTLLKKLNLGDIPGTAEEFPRWNKAKEGGQMVFLPVLIRRRAQERELFLTGVYGGDDAPKVR